MMVAMPYTDLERVLATQGERSVSKKTLTPREESGLNGNAMLNNYPEFIDALKTVSHTIKD